MTDQDLVFAALSEFAQTLVRRYAIADVLSELSEQTATALELYGAGVSVGDEQGVLRFVTCSKAALTEVERMQEARQDGPCVEAFREGRVVTSADLAAETRWPEYRPPALEHGLVSVAAIPLRNPAADADCGIGSLDLFADEPTSWTDDTIRTASLFADMAASYLANASDLQRSERLREQLQQALDSRVVIEQAKGLIAGQLGIGVEAGYQRLRSYTRSHNASLKEVANAVVNLGLRID